MPPRGNRSTEKACGKHARVVNGKQIAGEQELRKIGEVVIVESAGCALEHQEPDDPRSEGASCAIRSRGRSKSKSETFSELMDPGNAMHPFETPVSRENRPEHLVVVLAVAQKRLTQDAFLHGPEGPQGAVAATIRDGGAGFETMHPDGADRKINDQSRCFCGNTPVPQNGCPMTKPHSAVLKRVLRHAHLDDPGWRFVRPAGTTP